MPLRFCRPGRKNDDEGLLLKVEPRMLVLKKSVSRRKAGVPRPVGDGELQTWTDRHVTVKGEH